MTMRTPDDLHDPRFDDAWRRASRETPPPALDDAIRAAARREVGARPQDIASLPEATRPERWWFPLAAAATIGAIAIGLLQISTPDRVAPVDERRVVSDIPEDAKPVAQDPKSMPARASKSAAPASAPPPPAAPEASATTPAPAPPPAVPASPPAVAAAPEPYVTPPAERAPTPEPKPFPATPKREEAPLADASRLSPAPAPRKMEATPPAPAGAPSPQMGLRSNATDKAQSDVQSAPKTRALAAQAERSRDASTSAAAGTMAAEPSDVAAAPPAPPVGVPPMAAPQRAAARLSAERADSVATRAKERAAMPVADWIALMRRLRDEQRYDELAKELAAFRSTHADANTLLPPDLRDVAFPASGSR